MAKLDAKERSKIPPKDFAGPDKSYPIEDKSHARNALARASGKPVDKEVKAKVEAKYPDIKVDSKGNVQSKGGRPSRERGSSDGFIRRAGK